MQIDNYRADAIHVFQIGTLNSLRLTPRVTLVNKSHNKGNFATSYSIDVSIFPSRGEIRRIRAYTDLPIGEAKLIDCAQFIQDRDCEAIVIFHLIPSKFAGQDLVTTSREELWSLFTAQDHYVEYYDASGYAAGVLYQSGAFNYGKFSKERSTIIQAPKCYASAEIETCLQLTYSTFDPISEQPVGLLHCSLVAEGGVTVSRWTERFDPMSTRLVNLSEHLDAASPTLKKPMEKLRYACLYAYSDNATFLPVTISRNKKYGTLALEHSLPPNYYGNAVVGAYRKQVINALSSQSIFTGMTNRPC